MEQDLIKCPPVHEHPCTFTQQKKGALQKMFPAYKKNVDKLVNSMKASKKQGVMNNWVLNFPMHYDWCNPKLRNTARDYGRWAMVAFIEPEIIKLYCKQLLEKSVATWFLCCKARATLSKYTCPENHITNPSSFAATQEYLYLDCIETQLVQVPEHFDIMVDDFIAHQDQIKKKQEMVIKLQGLVKNLAKLKRIHARPDTTEARPAIASVLEDFVMVGCFHCNMANFTDEFIAMCSKYHSPGHDG